MTQNDLVSLLARVNADDPAAMYEYSMLVREENPAEAHKYAVLAAQLGNPNAMEVAGDDFYVEGDMAEAAKYYRSGAKAGLVDCSVKLAVINLAVDEQRSISELEELAEAGVPSACEALADYYIEHGNKKQAMYWRTRA